jgi:hypothetical protein
MVLYLPHSPKTKQGFLRKGLLRSSSRLQVQMPITPSAVQIFLKLGLREHSLLHPFLVSILGSERAQSASWCCCTMSRAIGSFPDVQCFQNRVPTIPSHMACQMRSTTSLCTDFNGRAIFSCGYIHSSAHGCRCLWLGCLGDLTSSTLNPQLSLWGFWVHFAPSNAAIRRQ